MTSHSSDNGMQQMWTCSHSWALYLVEQQAPPVQMLLNAMTIKVYCGHYSCCGIMCTRANHDVRWNLTKPQCSNSLPVSEHCNVMDLRQKSHLKKNNRQLYSLCTGQHQSMTEEITEWRMSVSNFTYVTFPQYNNYPAADRQQWLTFTDVMLCIHAVISM